MERLLPSEIARLVLGYLEEETEDVAQNFLEKSRFLAECFALAREGIEYTTKPYGKSLKDLLNELCAVHRLVKERLSKLPESSATPIRQCSLVEQITHLIDSTCSGQTLLVSITMPPSQGSSSASTPQSNGVGVSGSSSSRARSRPPNSSERTKRLALRLHMQGNSEEDTPETVTTAGVEATPSESLPGLSHERSPQISACPREINTPSSGTSDGPRDVSPGDRPRDVSPGGKSVLDAGECSVLGPSSASSTPKHKSSLSKRKGHPTPSKATMMTPGKNTAQTRPRRSLSEEDSNDDINLIPQFLKEAFLANNQLQQKLAESINRVIEAETSQSYPTKETTVVAERGAIDMLPSCDTSYEIDNIIRTVVQETEQDPLCEKLLGDILASFMDVIPPNTSVVEESTTPRKMTPSKSNKIVEGEECGEVPLKQRLRSSAKIRTDASTGTFPLLQQKRVKHRQDYGSMAREDTSTRKNKMDSILEESHAASGPDKLQAGSSLDAAEDGGGTISLKDQNDAAIQCIIDANIMCSDGRMISPGVPTVTQQQHMFPSAQPQQMFSQQDYLPQVEQHTPSMVSFDTSLGQLVSEACADMPEMSDIGNTELNKGTCLTNATEQNLTLVTPSSSHLTEQYIVLERSSFSHQLDGNITVNAATAVSENPLVLASSVATRVEGAALSKQNTTHQLPNAMPDDQVITESQLMNMPTLILCGNEKLLSIPQNKVCPTTHVVPFKIIPAKKKRPVAIAPSVKKRRTQTILPKPTFTFTADNQHPPMCISQNTMTSSIHSPKNITSSEIGKLTQQPLTSRIANSTKLLENKSFSTQLQTNKISKPKEDIASCSTANTSNVVHISDTNTCTLSLPKILDSPVTQVPSQSITEGIPGASEGEMQDKEEEKREQLLGALHLTQSPYKNRVPSTPNSSGKTPAGNDSVRLLSPQLMTLVNISKTNISNGTGEGKSPIDKRKEGSDGKISEAPRETPNNLSESQQETVNPRRLSLSTPRRRRNHIRALDFSTPPKFSLTPNMRKSFTSPKASGKKILPRSAKPIRRAGLFKSPPMVVNSQKNQCLFKAPAEKPTPTVLFKSPENSPTGNFDTTTLLTKDTSSTKVDAFCPIATRSPVPSLSGGWDKVTGAGLIFEDSSQKLLKHPSTESVEQGSNNNLEGIGVSSSQKNEYVESVTNNEDKLQKISSPAANKLSDMWDADLRAHLVPNYVEPEPPIKTTVQKLVKRSVQKPVKRGVKKPVKRSVKKSKANKAAKRNSRKVTAEEVRKLEEGLNIMSDIEGSDGIETIENKTNSLKSQVTLEVVPNDKNEQIINNNTSNFHQKSPKTKLVKRKNSALDKNINNLVTTTPPKGKQRISKGKKLKASTDLSPQGKLTKEKLENKTCIKKNMSKNVHNKSKPRTKYIKKAIVPEDKIISTQEVDNKDTQILTNKDSQNIILEHPKSSSNVPEVESNNLNNKELLKYSNKCAENKKEDSDASKSTLQDSNKNNLINSKSENTDKDKQVGTLLEDKSLNVDSPLVLMTQLDNTCAKVIQSPTNLKAAKRTFVKQDLKACQKLDMTTINVETSQAVVTSVSTVKSDTFTKSSLLLKIDSPSITNVSNVEISTPDKPISFKTPLKCNSNMKTDHPNESFNKPTNLISKITKSPVLDTPMKKNFTEPGPHLSDVSSLIPLTPRVLSPRAVEDTPITKFLKEQICSYESSFDTPSFPRTPNVPLTPRSSPQGNIEDQEYSTRPTDYSSCSSYYKPNEEIDPPNSSLEQVLIEECCRIEENTDVNKVEKSNEQTKEKEIPTGSSQENKHICDSESLQADNLKSPPVLNECCDVKESNISVSPKAKEREEIDKVLKDKPHGQSSSSIKTNIGTTLVEVSALVESGTDKSDIVLNLGIDKQNTSSVKTKSNQVTENCSKETSGESKSLPNIAPDYENKNKPITEMVISDEQQKTTNDKPSERCARTSLYYIKETKKIYSPKRSHRKQSRTKDRNSKKNVQTIIQDVISPEDKTKLISGFLNKARTEYAISLASSKDNSHNIELDKNELSKIKDGSKPELNESKTNRLAFDNVTGSPLLKSAKSRRLFDISSDSSDNSNGGASLQIQTSSSCFSSLESVNYEIHKSKHNELPLKQIHSDTNEASSSKSIIKNKDDEKEHCITPALETLNYEASYSSSLEGKISEDTNLDSPSTDADTITSTIASIVQETAQNVDKNEVFKNQRDKELLSELEDKRTRTLAKLKNPQNSKVKASTSKSVSENPPVVEAPLLEDKQTEFSKICSKGEECRFKEMRHPDEQSTFSTMERLQQQKEFQNLMKTPLKTPQSCLFSSPEEFPSLHLSSDDEVEGTSQTSGGLTPLSRVELQLAKIHGEKFKRNKMLQTPNKLKDTLEISNATNISLKEDTHSNSSSTTKNNIMLGCTNMTTLEMNDSASDTQMVSSTIHLQNILKTSPIKLKLPKKTLSKKLNKSIPILKKSSKKLESKSTSSKSSISLSKASKVFTKVIGNDIPLLKKETNEVNQTSTLIKSTLQEECKNYNELNNSTSKKFGVRHSDLSDQTHLNLINSINESCTLSEKQVITLEEKCVSENNPTPNKQILQEERNSYLETDVIQKENIIERFGGEEKCSSEKLGDNEEISSEKVIEVSEILENASMTSSIDHLINHQMSAQTDYVPNETKSLSNERKHPEKNKNGSSKQNDMVMKGSSKKQNVDLEKKTNASTKLNDVFLTENTPKNNLKLNNTTNDSKLEDSISSKTENKLIHKTKTSISTTKQSPLKILDSQPVATRGKTKQDLSEHSEPDLKPTKVIENSLTQKREHVKSLMTSKDSDKNIEIVSEVPLISEKTSSNCEKTITIIYKGDGPLCKRSVSPDNIENCSISTVIMGEDEDDMVVTARVTPFFELLFLKSQKDISLKDNELNKVANTRKHSFDTKPLNKMDESLLHKSTTKKQIETSRTGLKSKCVKKLDTDKQESCKSHSNYSQSASKRSNVNRALKKSNKMISPLSILDKEYELETRDIKNTRRSDHDRPSRKYEGKSKPRGSRYEERESQYRGPRRRTSSPHHRQRSWHRDLHRRSRTPTYRRVQKGSEDLTEDQSKIVYSRSSCERHIFQDSFTSPDRMKSRVTPAIKTRHKEEEEDLNVGDSHSAHSYTGDSVADIEELFQLQKGPFHPERSPFRLQDSPSDREEDDDLMTYALVGSHSKHKPSCPLPFKKSQCNDTLVRSSGTKTDQASTSASVRDERQSLPPKKRKASIEAAAPPPEKKACPDDPQMLLKKVDLEKFLSVVHGDMQ